MVSVCLFLGGGILDVIRRVDDAISRLNHLMLAQKADHEALESLKTSVTEIRSMLKDDKAALKDLVRSDKIN